MHRTMWPKAGSRPGWLEARHLPLIITGSYLLCSVLWMLVALHFVHHDRNLVLEDGVYIFCTAALIFILLHLGVGTVRAKEAALRESEDRLARILETNASGIVVFDDRGRISYANHSASEILGEDRRALIGRRHDDPSWNLADLDGNRIPAGSFPVAKVRESGLPVYDVQFSLRRRDGRRTYLMANAAPLQDAEGKRIGIVASFADITKRKEEEQQKIRKLLLAMDQSPSAIVITDLDGRVEYANPRFAEVTGSGKEDAPGGGMPYPFRIPADRMEEVRAATRAGEGWKAEFEYDRTAGVPSWVSTSVSPIRAPEGGPTGYLWVQEDVTDRKIAEQALRRSEANYRAVVEDQTELICRFSPGGALSFVNEAFCRYFGMNRGSLLGRFFPDLADDPDLLGRSRHAASLSREHPPIEYEGPVTVAGGEVRWLRWTERAVFDASGNFVEIQAVGTDVTEHRNADAALRETREKFRILVETISDWVWEIDRDGVYTYVSPKIRDLLGYDPQEVLGKTPFDLMDPAEANRVAETFRTLASHRRPFTALENVCRHKDGRQVMIETSGVPFFGPEGTFQGYRGVDRDIGERKRSEELLRASEERFRQLFEQNEEPLFLFRYGTPEILDANPAAAELYGYRREALCAEGLSLFVAPRDREAFSSSIAGIRPEAPLIVEQASHVRRDGQEVIVSIRAKAIRTKDGYVAYCSFRDITARIRMEQEAKLQQAQLIHANRMASLGGIVSGVAHEVNNPNNLIMFNVPMVLEAWRDALPILDRYGQEHGAFTLAGLPFSEMREVVPTLLDGVSEASGRIKAIVGDLKDFAKREENRPRKPEGINGIVRSAVRILNHDIVQKTHVFETDLAQDMPPVMGSRQQLEQVVVNLLQNALQALPSTRSAVRVRTGRNGASGDVEVHVVDEGIGMPPDVMARITEPFFSTRLENGGLGLGLSISRSIVESHGGSLHFESEVGKGTRAVIRLPALVGAPHGRASEDAPPVPVGR